MKLWMKRMRWKAAAAVAFLMGIPFVEEAHAGHGGVGGIIGGALTLTGAIIDVAGDS